MLKITANDIIRTSEKVINKWHEKEKVLTSLDDAINLIAFEKDEFLMQVERIAIANTVLWHEEDKARDTGATDETIAEVKRRIDKLNAARVKRVEQIDELIYNAVKMNEQSPLNTETPASVIDRLTILALKRSHMDIEANRGDASQEHKDNCAAKLKMIHDQQADLCASFDNLMEELSAGKRRFRMYKQFKMYNDPCLNPVLYGKKVVLEVQDDSEMLDW